MICCIKSFYLSYQISSKVSLNLVSLKELISCG